MDQRSDESSLSPVAQEREAEWTCETIPECESDLFGFSFTRLDDSREHVCFWGAIFALILEELGIHLVRPLDRKHRGRQDRFRTRHRQYIFYCDARRTSELRAKLEKSEVEWELRGKCSSDHHNLPRAALIISAF